MKLHRVFDAITSITKETSNSQRYTKPLPSSVFLKGDAGTLWYTMHIRLYESGIGKDVGHIDLDSILNFK